MTAPIRVRMFASLKDAAGESTTEVAASTVVEACGVLSARYGDVFADRLSRSRVAIGEDLVTPDSVERLEPGSEIALLPPFAGG